MACQYGNFYKYMLGKHVIGFLMSAHYFVTEEQKMEALVDGFMAGKSADIIEPPQLYKGNTSLLVCWYWGYYQGKREKSDG